MRRPRRGMRTAVHPDHAVTFRGLRPNVNGDHVLGVGIAFFPDSEVSHCAHLVGQNIGFTLMMAERQTRSVIRQRPQTACLVQGESAIVGELGTTAALERVFMQSRRQYPVMSMSNARGACPAGATGPCA